MVLLTSNLFCTDLIASYFLGFSTDLICFGMVSIFVEKYCRILVVWAVTVTAQKMKFFIKNFFSKCDQIHSFLRIWSHLLKKSLMGNVIFFVQCVVSRSSILQQDFWHKTLLTHQLSVIFEYTCLKRSRPFFVLPCFNPMPESLPRIATCNLPIIPL